MSTIGKWNFDQDPHVLAEKQVALNLYRQQATAQRQQYAEGLRIVNSNLDGLMMDAHIAAEKAAGKRPLLDAERLKTQTNQEKLTQARIGLDSAKLSTGIAGDGYQGLRAEQGIRRQLIGHKLRGLQLQAEQLRAQSEATHQSLSLELGQSLPLPSVPTIGGAS